EHHLLAARALARSDDRPAKRLGNGVAQLVARQLASARMLEDVCEPAARLGAGGGPVLGRSAARRELGEAADRLPERVVADLGPGGIGPRLHDDVALRTHLRQELANESRLAHSDVADEPRADERRL